MPVIRWFRQGGLRAVGMRNCLCFGPNQPAPAAIVYSMRISLIAALSRNHVIGKDNQLPWDLPADLSNFRRITAGHPFIMGRKSFESPHALLSDTFNIILSRQETLRLPPRAVRADSWPEALRRAAATGAEEVFVLGGATVFARALPVAERLYLTLVDATLEGDAYFPPIDWSRWQLRESHHHGPDARHAYAFRMDVYEALPGG